MHRLSTLFQRQQPQATEATAWQHDLPHKIAVRQFEHGVDHFVHLRAGVVQRRIGRSLDHYADNAVILHRRQFLPRKQIERCRQEGKENASAQNLLLPRKDVFQQPPVGMPQLVKAGVHPASGAAFASAFRAGMRTHNRRQRQGDHPGNQHRNRQGKGKFLKDDPGQPGQKPDGRIDRR